MYCCLLSTYKAVPIVEGTWMRQRAQQRTHSERRRQTKLHNTHVLCRSGVSAFTALLLLLLLTLFLLLYMDRQTIPKIPHVCCCVFMLLLIFSIHTQWIFHVLQFQTSVYAAHRLLLNAPFLYVWNSRRINIYIRICELIEAKVASMPNKSNCCQFENRIFEFVARGMRFFFIPLFSLK